MKKISSEKSQLIKEARRKRIRERGINWQEKYGERSKDLKEKFESIIGPGSYFRWEGHDYTSSSDYFVVVGPATQKTGQKSFFAGIKKMPPLEKRKKVYAPSGKYFTSITSALSHANQMWGTPIPDGNNSYDADLLQNIKLPRHIKG
jgi:hypothetical protein